MNAKPPKRVWLQRDDDMEPLTAEDWECTTWCQEQVNDLDVEYIRIDLHRAAVQRAKSDHVKR